MGTSELEVLPRATRCRSAAHFSRGPGRRNQNETDSETMTLGKAGGIAACSHITSYSESSHDGIPGPIPETKLATVLIVGWSNRSVCGSSELNHLVSVLANSVAAIESRPEAMSGAFVPTNVPCTSQMIAEIVSTTKSTFGEAFSLGETSQRNTGLEIRSYELHSDSSGGLP